MALGREQSRKGNSAQWMFAESANRAASESVREEIRLPPIACFARASERVLEASKAKQVAWLRAAWRRMIEPFGLKGEA
jgi:hypothetical protein